MEPMNYPLRAFIGGSGFRNSFEDTKVLLDAIEGDIGLPHAAGSRLHTLGLSCTIDSSGSKVLKVLGTGSASQVCDPVVVSNAVDVVNVVRRPFTVGMKPRKPMSPVVPAINTDKRIAVVIDSEGNVSTSACGAASPTDSPCEDPRLRVVVEKLAQTLRGNICLSHEALQLLIGQRPASVDALRGLRHFRLGAV